MSSYREYISKKLNQIYIIQWMLVGTAKFILMMTESEKMSAGRAIGVGLVFVIMAISISKLWDKIRNKARAQ